MALITTQEDPTKKDASYYKNMRDSLYNKSKFYEDLFNKTEDETERNKLLDSIAKYDALGSEANKFYRQNGGSGQLTEGSNPNTKSFGDTETKEMPGMGGIQSVLGIGGALLAGGAINKMILPKGSFSTHEFLAKNRFKQEWVKLGERFNNLGTFRGTQQRIANNFAQGVSNSISNRYDAGYITNKTITKSEFKDLARKGQAYTEGVLRSKPDNMRNTYKIVERKLVKELKKNGINIVDDVITTSTNGKRTYRPKVKPAGGGSGTLSFGGLTNEDIEKAGRFVAKTGRNIIKTARSLPVDAGVNSFLNYVDNDSQDRYNAPGNLIKATAKTAYDFNPITVTKGISGLGLDISNKISGKRKGIIDSKSINNTLDFMDNIRNLPLNVVNKVTTIADNAMVNTAKSKMQEEKDLRQRYDDKKFIEKIKNSSVSSGLDYLNVATKGLNTQSSQKSFDNMLIDMGYNPNEMTNNQKKKIINIGKGLIIKKLSK